MLDNVLGAGLDHNAPHTPDEWRAYIAEATVLEREADQTKVEAIIEKGRRIAEFRTYYEAHKDEFVEKTRAKACKAIVGVKRAACVKYEFIRETFVRNTNIGFLPPNLDCLYDLGRAIDANRKTFEDALAGGEINPLMSRPEAKAIAQRAAMESGGDTQMIALFKAGHDPVQIARKLGLMNGEPRNDLNARIRVARALRKLGFVTKRGKAKGGGKGKVRIVAGPSFETQRAQQAEGHRTFHDHAPTGAERVGLDPLQKVHLHAFSVKQMVDAQAATHGLVTSITNVADPRKPDAEAFMEMIGEMLAWVPDKSRKGTGYDTDYAAKARKTMEALDLHLGRAVDRLAALQALIRAKKIPS